MTYPSIRRTRYDAVEQTLRRTPYRRTWALAKSLRESAADAVRVHPAGQQLPPGRGSATRSGREAPAAGRAPLDAFLFDTKEGYCQHFSGAMALLLRMGGVPARVATGFSPGGFSKRRDAWIVRDTDAHAWVEAWFDELGWVTYDPTPDLTPARSQIAALEAPAAAAAVPGAEADPAAGGSSAGGRRLGGVRPDLLLDPQRNNPVDGSGAAQDGGIRVVGVAARGRGGGRRGGRARAPPPAPRARPAVAARPRGRRAGGRAAPRRPPARDRHDAAPARAAPRRHARGRRLPARAQRLALRPGGAAADGRRSAARCAARSRRASARPAACARCGRCRRAPV